MDKRASLGGSFFLHKKAPRGACVLYCRYQMDILFLRSSSSGGKEHTFWRSLCRPSGIFCTHRLFWTIQSLRRECTTHSENACTLTLVRLNTCSCQIDHPFWWLNTHFRYYFAVIILILSYINAVLVRTPLSSKCPWSDQWAQY